MSTSPSVQPKEDVAKEIGRIASTLTDDMQSALKKARDLGFDLTRGRLTLEETLINFELHSRCLIGCRGEMRAHLLATQVAIHAVFANIEGF
jgi:hypothetical protein